MARTNAPVHTARRGVNLTQFTYEGAPAAVESPPQALYRVIAAHLLWEDSFYISGKESADVLAAAVQAAADYDAEMTATVIKSARNTMHIRHASLYGALHFAYWAAKQKGKYGGLARATVREVIQRADEMAEMLALNGLVTKDRKRMPHAVRKGIADAFKRFDEYQFGKWKNGQIRLKDAVFLTHPKREDDLITKIVTDTLATPDTWETQLSGGADKKETFERLMSTNKLGAMALLRNLRNMEAAGVDPRILGKAFENARWDQVFPFRFIAAGKAAPQYARMLDTCFQRSKIAGGEPLPFANVLFDCSGSMDNTISAKSQMRRSEAARALAVCYPGPYRLFGFGSTCAEVPAYGGLVDALERAAPNVGHGTMIGAAVRYASAKSPDAKLTIVVTDEQSSDLVGAPLGIGCMINVAAYQKGVEAGDGWIRLSGYSEQVYRYLRQILQGMRPEATALGYDGDSAA